MDKNIIKMEVIKIVSTDDKPNIILDKDNNTFEFSGRSLPEDVKSFYRPILDWLDKYAQSPNEKTEVNFRFDYFNRASSRMILEILQKLEGIYKEGHPVKILWYYFNDDEYMEETGKEYSELVNIPFEFIPM